MPGKTRIKQQKVYGYLVNRQYKINGSRLLHATPVRPDLVQIALCTILVQSDLIGDGWIIKESSGKLSL